MKLSTVAALVLFALTSIYALTHIVTSSPQKRTPITAVQAQVRYLCETDTGARGILYAEHCWPLATKKLDWRSVSSWGLSSRFTDLSPLAGLADLEEINLGYSNFGAVALYSKPHNQINDISALSKLKNLKRLNLTLAEVSDISPLSEITELEYLNLDATQVEDLSPLRKMIKLRELSIKHTKVKNIQVLSNIENLIINK